MGADRSFVLVFFRPFLLNPVMDERSCDLSGFALAAGGGGGGGGPGGPPDLPPLIGGGGGGGGGPEAGGGGGGGGMPGDLAGVRGVGGGEPGMDSVSLDMSDDLTELLSEPLVCLLDDFTLLGLAAVSKRATEPVIIFQFSPTKSQKA